MDPSDSKGAEVKVEPAVKVEAVVKVEPVVKVEAVVKVEPETEASTAAAFEAQRSMKRVKAEGGFSQALEAPDKETPSAGKMKAEISTEKFFNALSVTTKLMEANPASPSTVWLYGYGCTSETDSDTDSAFESGSESEYEYETGDEEAEEEEEEEEEAEVVDEVKGEAEPKPQAEAEAEEDTYDISLPTMKREYYLTKADMAFKSHMLAKMGAKMLATEFDNQNLLNMVRTLKDDLNRKRAEFMALINNCMASGNIYEHIKGLFLMKMISEHDNEYFREMCKVYAARGVKSCNHPVQFQARIQQMVRSIAAAAARIRGSRCRRPGRKF